MSNLLFSRLTSDTRGTPCDNSPSGFILGRSIEHPATSGTGAPSVERSLFETPSTLRLREALRDTTLHPAPVFEGATPVCSARRRRSNSCIEMSPRPPMQSTGPVPPGDENLSPGGRSRRWSDGGADPSRWSAGSANSPSRSAAFRTEPGSWTRWASDLSVAEGGRQPNPLTQPGCDIQWLLNAVSVGLFAVAGTLCRWALGELFTEELGAVAVSGAPIPWQQFKQTLSLQASTLLQNLSRRTQLHTHTAMHQYGVQCVHISELCMRVHTERAYAQRELHADVAS